MPDRVQLSAHPRSVIGKRVKHLRRQGYVPATVYGHDVSPLSIQVDAREFRAVHIAAGDAQLIDLVIDSQPARPVIIHSTQIDPRRNTTMHVEFYQANLRQKLTASIPIHITGESPATKQGAMVLPVLDHLVVECLPDDLPAQIELDVSGLTEVGDALHVRDIPIDHSRVEVKANEDDVVVKIEAPQAGIEEVEEPIEAEAAVAGEEQAAGTEETA